MTKIRLVIKIVLAIFVGLALFSCGENNEVVDVETIACNDGLVLEDGVCIADKVENCANTSEAEDDLCVDTTKPAPVYQPQPGEVVIYYNRRDKNFDGWVLHLWSDCNDAEAGSWDGEHLTANYAFEGDATVWPEGPAPNYQEYADGLEDPIYGIYWVLKIEEDATCGNFIIHNTEGTIQTADYTFNFSPETPDNNIFWVLVDTIEAENNLSSANYDTQPICINDECKPYIPPPLAVVNAEAHWVGRHSILWHRDLINVRLYTSPLGELQVSNEGEILGSENALVLNKVGVGLENNTLFPHLDTYYHYAIESDLDSIKNLLKHQLYVVGEDLDGKLFGTKLQIAGVLDDIYTSLPSDADEADFGPVYNDDSTISLSLWAPTANNVRLIIYDMQAQSDTFTAIQQIDMALDASTGIWEARGDNAWDRKYYRFVVTVYNPISDGVQTLEVQDPWSLNTSMNGHYSQIVNLNDPELKPEGWDGHDVPQIESIESAVIYEGHIRDFSIRDASTVEAHRGKYLAFTDPDSDPVKHLQALQYSGLSHFHILPMYDIASINEDEAQQINLTSSIVDLCDSSGVLFESLCDAGVDTSQPLLSLFESYSPGSGAARDLVDSIKDADGFNWGYDPVFYNVPEGSYATNPNGVARIVELRAMIKSLHEMGLRTVMDVVYNHTSDSGVSSPNAIFDKIVPGYYFRRNVVTGAVENASCCNDTASERRMMAKLVEDSLLLWSQQYGIDAFRFDIMSLMPKKLIDESLQLVKSYDPDVYFYGEGWNMPLSTAEDSIFIRATQLNMSGTGVGTFNDRMRDPMRYLHIVNGKSLNRLRAGLAGNLANYQLLTQNGTLINASSDGGYAFDPQESINYVEKHDNETLWDWIHQSGNLPASTSLVDRVRIQNLTQALVLYSQGVPFIHMGSDLLRSKSMDGNSYNSGDWFNYIDFTKTRNNWRVGLPPKGGNKANDEQVIAAFDDSESLPGSEEIRFASKIFNETLGISTSSPLFSLKTETEIIDRVGFHNMGRNGLQNLIVMSIDDGIDLSENTGVVREDIDVTVDALVVIFNGNSEEQRISINDASGFILHPDLQNSADMRVRESRFIEGATPDVDKAGTFVVPALTAAVFIKSQQGEPGIGLAPPALVPQVDNSDTVGADDGDVFGGLDVYVRGEMNSWGIDNRLEPAAEGLYVARIMLSPGIYPFKIATEDWSTVNLGADGNAIVALDEQVRTGEGSQTNFTIDIPEAGEYEFNVDAREIPVTFVVRRKI